MYYLFQTNSPLQNIFSSKENSYIKQILLILGGAILLAIASQISIPLKPVPLTFQSATVVFIGMALGARNGTYAILTYLCAGICGLPVFADWSFGPAVFFGHTGGYLMGFLPAVYISGLLAEKGFANNIFTSFLAACIGTAPIFGLGVAILATFVGWNNAIALGLMPFVVSEIVKLIAVATVTPRFWKKA